MASDATCLFQEMYADVVSSGLTRKVSDPLSPQQDEMLEALPGRSYTLWQLNRNVPGQRSVDLRWAIVNTLQFFADTDHGGWLRKYNTQADRFLTGDRWIGAYGLLCMWQIRESIAQLKADQATRRAIATFGDLSRCDANQPSCINCMHFIVRQSKLDMIVYQRSLNLWGVMPYDCVLLTNILCYVARATQIGVGVLRWMVGSLHMPSGKELALKHDPNAVILPYEVLCYAPECQTWLGRPELAREPWRSILLEGLHS